MPQYTDEMNSVISVCHGLMRAEGFRKRRHTFLTARRPAALSTS